MNQKQRDGLVINHSIILIDEKKPGFPIRARMIQFLAILLGSWGSISVLLESIQVPADKGILFPVLFLCAVIVFGLCLIPGPELVKIFFGVLFYGLFLYSRLPALKNGYYILENRVIDRIVAYYNMASFQFVADNTRAVEDTTLLMAMITIPVVALFTIAIVRNCLSAVAGILLFLPITISFLFGLVPSEPYLLAYMAAVLYLSQSSFSSRFMSDKEQKLKLHRINSRAAICLCLLCLLLFTCLKLFVTEKTYQEIETIGEAKEKLQSELYSISLEDLSDVFGDFRLFYYDTAVGGLDGGHLNNVAKIKFSQSEQLEITAPLESITNGVYLKGYVGSVYTGDSWDVHTEEMSDFYEACLGEVPEERFSPVNQMSQILREFGRSAGGAYYNPYKISIEYRAANKRFLYTPYFTDVEKAENVTIIDDLYAAPSSRKNNANYVYYSIDLDYFMENASLFSDNLSDEYHYYENQYSEFVRATYLTLPEEGLERLKKDFAFEQPATTMEEVSDKIIQVQQYLWENTEYSLEPGLLPEGKDYVEYFLYENKKGFCAHYATTAVLMLRSMGVPARYVEGYAIGASDVVRNTISSNRGDLPSNQAGDAAVNITLSVKDYNAHAWVEVYIEDYGWLPFDPTPGSNVGYAGNQQSQEEITQAPTKPPATPTPRVTQRPKQEEPKITQTPAATGKSGSDGNGTQEKFLSLMVLLFFGLTAAVIILMLMLRMRKIRENRTNNRKAIIIFTKFSKILRSLKELSHKKAEVEDCEEYIKENSTLFETGEFETFMEIIKKARFSREIISNEELYFVKRFHNKLVQKVERTLSLRMRIYLAINRFEY